MPANTISPSGYNYSANVPAYVWKHHVTLAGYLWIHQTLGELRTSTQHETDIHLYLDVVSNLNWSGTVVPSVVLCAFCGIYLEV